MSQHKGSKYNVMVEWESGEVTYEPLTLISKDDPITCAVYAKKHDLLDTTGWKHLKRYAKTSRRLIRAVKQSRIRQVRASARYLHGFQVPKDYNDAMRLDQIHEYKVSRTQVKHNSTMEKWSYLMVSKRSESTLYMQSNMMADSKQDLLQMDISPKNLLNHLFWSGFLEEPQDGCIVIPTQ